MQPNAFKSAVAARLAEIESEASHLRALLTIYGGTVHVVPPASVEPSVSPEAASKRQVRAFAPGWEAIVRFLIETHAADSMRTVHLNDLEAVDNAQPVPLTRGRIRQQLHNWKSRGFVENPSQGIFRLTADGFVAFKNESGSPAAGGEPDAEIESGSERIANTELIEPLNHNP